MNQKIREKDSHTFYQRMGKYFPVKHVGCKRILIPEEEFRLENNTIILDEKPIQEDVWAKNSGRFDYSKDTSPLIQEWLKRVLELDEGYSTIS